MTKNFGKQCRNRLNREREKDCQKRLWKRAGQEGKAKTVSRRRKEKYRGLALGGTVKSWQDERPLNNERTGIKKRSRKELTTE